MKDFVPIPVSITLRAPRMAIVVPDIEPWHYFACLVLSQASKVWGGAGFILIPHTNGIVKPHSLQMAIAFDPDHIVAATALRADLMEVNPDQYPTVDATGNRITASEVRALALHFQSPLSKLDAKACDQVAEACTPFRTFDPDDGVGTRMHYSLPQVEEELLVVPASETAAVVPSENLRLSARRFETRELAVLRASKTGLVHGFSDPREMSLEDQDELLTIATDVFSLQDFRSVRNSFDWAGRGRWEASLQGLVPVTDMRMRPQFFIIVGDGLEDFSLFHALDRLSGNAIWFPETWLSSESPYHSLVRRALRNIYHHQENSAAKVQVLSSSADSLGIGETLRAIRDELTDLGGDSNWFTAVELKDFDFGGVGKGFLALSQDYDRELVLTAVETADSLEFAHRIPPLIPETQEVLAANDREWIIDLDVHGSQMPRGRGLRGDLLEVHDSVWHERVRSGRNGIAVMSRSFGFVLSGSTLRQSLARPRLRTLGLFEWVTHQAAAKGWTVSISEAGQRAASAARLWGSREALANDLSKLRPFFMEFKATNGMRSDDRYLPGCGDVVGDEGFLTFEGAVRILNPSGSSDLEIRNTLDGLTALGVLRRGVILRCLECGKLQWISVSDLGLTTPCRRCQVSIPINISTWRSPVRELAWSYDLHPIVRSLLDQDGDVPILAGGVLREEMHGGDVLPEIIFKGNEGEFIEIDVLFGSPNHIAIGECKTSPNIPSRQRKKKFIGLATVAEILQVDRLILASGDSGAWSDLHQSDLETQLQYYRFAGGRFPKVEVFSGLRHPRSVS
jgi:hypothetical protein